MKKVAMKYTAVEKKLRIGPPAPGTQVLRRAHDVLRLLALHSREGLKLSEISASLNLEPPTAHRILQGLIQERMATQELNKRYNLGPALYELGLTAGSRFPLLDFVQPTVKELAKLTGDTLVVTIRSGLDGVCIEKQSGEFPIQTSMVSVGTRRPLASGAGGLAIMSCIEKEELKWIVGQNAEEMRIDMSEIFERVEEAQRVGYALNTYRQTTPQIAALAVPVFGAFGRCVAGLAIVALSMRLSGKRRTEILKLLRSESEALSQVLSKQAVPH
jgi:DNA-binding IclR family transcriptional regulator